MNNIIIGDFNVGVSDPDTKFYCNLGNGTICYKNLENPECIDLILTNSPSSFYFKKLILRPLYDEDRSLQLSQNGCYYYENNLSKITSENKNLQELK